MRFIVVGAGAVGGVVAARLRRSGHNVVVVARGPHLAAITESGLRVESPAGSEVIGLPAVSSPAEVEWGHGDVVLLCVKSQDTRGAVADLAAAAPPSIPVVCLQNGVANEPEALRRFDHVYGAMVVLPAAHLEPGVVVVYSDPTAGIIDVGRFPHGVDLVARSVARALERSTFSAHAVPDITRWKYRKLVTNVANALQVVSDDAGDDQALADRIQTEAETVLAAAGIGSASAAEDEARREGHLQLAEVAGSGRAGNSSWQSLRRRTGSVETDWLNGEIVMLGRLHGVPTPLNTLFQGLVDEMAAVGEEPGAMPRADLDALIVAAERPPGHPPD
jgi:2-dehydropantoate 2-reductase